MKQLTEETIYKAEKNGIVIEVIFNGLNYRTVVTQYGVNEYGNEVTDEEATEYVDLTGNCMTSWEDNGYTGNGTPAFEEILQDFDEQNIHGIGQNAAEAIDEHVRNQESEND